MADDQAFLKKAITLARDNAEAGGRPFGALVVKDGAVVATGVNRIVDTNDPTEHAELNAIRAASRKLASPRLDGYIVYASGHPCPMCMAALHWSRVDKVYFGASIPDAEAAGFNELALPAADLLRVGRSRVTLEGGLLAEPCRSLFEEWKSLHPRPY